MVENHTAQSTVDERAAATYLDYTPAALRAWRNQGRGPAFIRIGRSIRYRIPDLDAWLERHRVETRDTRDAR